MVWANENHQSTTIEIKTFIVGANGQMTYKLNLKTPSTPGKYTLIAEAYWDKQLWSPVISRRHIEIK